MNTPRIPPLITAGLAAALAWGLAGCPEKQDSPPPTPTTQNRAQPREQVLADTIAVGEDAAAKAREIAAQAWDDAKNFTYEQRARFSSSVRQMSDRLDRQIDTWSTRRADLSADTRGAWDNALARYREARGRLDREVAQLGGASNDTWEATKARVAQAWADVERAFRDLESHMTA